MTAAAWTAVIIAEARMVADGIHPVIAREMTTRVMRVEQKRRRWEARQ
jgi:hypothetical protein